MTTGTRLKNPSIVLKIASLLLSATLWCGIGSFIGWQAGNAGGFRRGVNLTADLIITLMDKKEDTTSLSPRKYQDL